MDLIDDISQGVSIYECDYLELNNGTWSVRVTLINWVTTKPKGVR